jgi:hypothetical protein
MIPYRPIAPLTVGPQKGWKVAIAAVVMAALLGTTAPVAVAAEPELASTATSVSAVAPQLLATDPARRSS